MKGLGRGLGVLMVVWALAAPSAQAAPSFVPAGKGFGFNANLAPADDSSGTRTLDAAYAAGADYMRIGISWRSYQQETSYTKPIPPSFSTPVGQTTSNGETNRVDRLYQQLAARGMKPILMIVDAPDWASTFHTCLTNPVDAANATKCPKDWRTKARVLYAATDRFDAFRAFVSAVARRYPNAVIEGTNEPDFQKQFQPQYHPPVWQVAAGQCALAGAVRSVDPARRVLSPGFYLLPYAEEFVNSIGQNHNCYTDFSLHIFGSTEVRGGFASGVADELAQLRIIIGSGHRIFITETSLSNTVSFNDVNFNDKADKTGEPLVSRAYPRWLSYFLNQPDIDGVLIHTVRQEQPGDVGDQLGYGLLNPDFTPKDAGPGIIPRFCYLALSSARTYPGCGGFTLPGPPAPSAPSFFKSPHLIFGKDTKVGGRTRVLFFEEGEPLPNVTVTWYRCNAIGTGCKPVFLNHTTYIVQSADRTNRIKAVVSLSNSKGSTTGETALSPVITG